MLGLAILFGLFVWVVITIVFMIIGYFLGKKVNYPKTGVFIGYMLTMGGWIVYWIAEYHYIQHKVNHLCKTEGGITVYITPEEWRKMIGEEEWSQLTEFNYSQKQYYPTEKIVVNNVDYYPSSSINARLVKYSSHKKINEFIGQNNSLVIDLKSNTILMNYRYYSAGVGAWLAGGNPKFWLNEIHDCNDSISQEFSNLIRFYSKSQ